MEASFFVGIALSIYIILAYPNRRIQSIYTREKSGISAQSTEARECHSTESITNAQSTSIELYKLREEKRAR